MGSEMNLPVGKGAHVIFIWSQGLLCNVQQLNGTELIAWIVGLQAYWG